MTDLKSLLPEELEAFLCETGESAYRARQVFEWVHKKDVADFAQMTDLPLSLREKLARTAFVTAASVEKKLVSARDGTVKFLFGFEDGEKVESVLMRYKHGNTVCRHGNRKTAAFCALVVAGQNGFQSAAFGIHAAVRGQDKSLLIGIIQYRSSPSVTGSPEPRTLRPAYPR